MILCVENGDSPLGGDKAEDTPKREDRTEVPVSRLLGVSIAIGIARTDVLVACGLARLKFDTMM